MPFCMMAVLLFIICNQVLQSELGIIDLRGSDMLQDGCGYRNTSLIWGPTDEISALLDCHESVDLLIPRGSNSFVQYIMNNTKIPLFPDKINFFLPKTSSLFINYMKVSSYI